MTTTRANYRAMRAYDPRLVREAVAAGLYEPNDDQPMTETERNRFNALVQAMAAEERRARAHYSTIMGHHATCGCPLCL